MGGADPDSNLRLRYAINDARAVSMPRDNIERAIKRGTGELEGGEVEEIVYEGYGPGGLAVLCEIMTMEALDDHDDVQNVSANFTIPEAALAALGAT